MSETEEVVSDSPGAKKSKKELQAEAKAKADAEKKAQKEQEEKERMERIIAQRAVEQEKQRIAAEEEKKRKEAQKLKEIEQKKKAEADKIAFAEAKAKKDAEEAEKKRIADEQAAERKRIREEKQKAVDGRSRFLAEQCDKVAPETLFKELIDVAISGDEHDFDELVDEWEGHPVLDQKDLEGWGIEHWLCKKGHIDCLTYLVEKKWWNKHDVDPSLEKIVRRLNLADENGYTLLHFAAIGGHTEVVEYLVGKGVNINAQNGDGFTAISWATFHNHFDTMVALHESGAKLGLSTRGGKTPYGIASALNYAQCTQYLSTATDAGAMTKKKKKRAKNGEEDGASTTSSQK